MPKTMSDRPTFLFTAILICCLAMAGVGYREARLIEQENELSAIHDQMIKDIREMMAKICSAKKTEQISLLTTMATMQKGADSARNELEKIRSMRWFYIPN